MRIAFIVGTFPTVSETFILNQITGLIDLRHDVRVFSFHRPLRADPIHPSVRQYSLLERTIYLPESRFRNYWLHRLHAGLLFPLFCLQNRKLFSYLANWELFRGYKDIGVCAMIAKYYRGSQAFDVTHAQFGGLGARLVRPKMAGLLGGALVTSFRGSDTTVVLSVRPDAYAKLFRCGDAFFTVSRFIRDRIVSHGAPPNRVFVHPSGIRIDEFPFAVRRFPADGRVRVLCLARLIEVKGVGYLIEAVKELDKRGYEIRLDIAGDGPLMAEYQRLIRGTPIAKKVFLRGFCEKSAVIKLLREAHILVAPSVVASDQAEEGMPNAVKEAMATGLPVVATATGGIPEIVEDGKTGLLVPQRDSQAIAEKVAYLIDHHECCVSLALAARERIVQGFSSDLLNEQLVKVYHGLCTG